MIVSPMFWYRLSEVVNLGQAGRPLPLGSPLLAPVGCVWI